MYILSLMFIWVPKGPKNIKPSVSKFSLDLKVVYRALLRGYPPALCGNLAQKLFGVNQCVIYVFWLIWGWGIHFWYQFCYTKLLWGSNPRWRPSVTVGFREISTTRQIWLAKNRINSPFFYLLVDFSKWYLKMFLLMSFITLI